MRYLLFISGLFFLQGCSSLYRALKKTQSGYACVTRFKPQFSSVVYDARADVAGRHLSGLLVIKKMPDSSTRIVFTSQLGFTFFDFEFSADDHFSTHSILKQMNKKAVIKTLRKDFELVLMQGLKEKGSYSLMDSTGIYTAFPQSSGTYYYVTDRQCERLLKMQRASRTKVVMEAVMSHSENSAPDTIGISHKNFNFDIGLKKLER
jgi:hypothetical protein